MLSWYLQHFITVSESMGSDIRNVSATIHCIWISKKLLSDKIMVKECRRAGDLLDNRVRELRNEKGIRQVDLAGKINVSQQTISRIENGQNSLPADILIHLSKFFHVSADYILKLSDTRLIPEYRFEVDKNIERNMGFLRAFERLSRVNKELVTLLISQLEERQKENR